MGNWFTDYCKKAVSIVTPLAKQVAKPAAGTKTASTSKAGTKPAAGTKSQPKPKASKQPINFSARENLRKKDADMGLKIESCPAESTRVAAGAPKLNASQLPPTVNLFAKILPSAAELLNLKKPNLKQNPKAQITHKGKKVTIVEVHNESKDDKGKKVEGYVVAQDDTGNKVNIPTHSSLSDPKINGLKDDSGKVVYFASYGKPHEAHVLDDNETKNHRKREARAISNLVEKDGKRYILKGDKAKQAVSHIHDPELMKEVNNEIALKQKRIDSKTTPQKGFTHLEEALHQGNYHWNDDKQENTADLIKTLRNNGAYGPKFQLDENGKPKIDPATGKHIANPEYAEAMGRNAGRILHESAKNAGTNEDGISAGLSLLDNEESMKSVNKYLTSQGRKTTADASPLENLLLSENSHSKVQEQIKTLFDQGAYGEPHLFDENGEIKEDANGRPIENKYYTDSMARNAFREIEHEINGITSIEGLKSAMDIVNNSPGARLAVDELIKLKHPDLKPDLGSYTRALIKDDGWSDIDVNKFDAAWVANKSYAPAIVDKNGIVLEPGDQEHRNRVIDNLCFNDKLPESEANGEFKEYFRIGLDAIDAPPENSADFMHFKDKCQSKIDKKPDAYPPEFKNQDPAQRYMHKWFDAEGMNANNTLLFKGAVPPRVEAEASLRLMRTGDYSHSFDSLNAETYKVMDDMLKYDDAVPGVKNLKSCYDKAIAGAVGDYNKAKIQGNAIISGQIDFSDAEAADICFKLMEFSGKAKGKSVSNLFGGGWENDSEYFDYQIKNIMESRYDVIGLVETKLDYRRAQRAQNPLFADGKQDLFCQKYYKMIGEARENAVIVGKDQVFLGPDGKPITDPKKIKDILEENNNTLEAARQQMLLLEREYKKYVDSEGWIGDAANLMSRSLLRGTDRGDVELMYRKSRAFYKKLEAASQGLLRDPSGNVISMQQLIDNEMHQLSAQYGSINDKYKASQKVGKGAIYAAPAIIITTFGTGGGSSVLATAALAAAEVSLAEFTLGGTDMLTSETGNTKERQYELVYSSLRDGAIAGLTFGAGKYLENLAIVRKYEAAEAALEEMKKLDVKLPGHYQECMRLENFLAENAKIYEHSKKLASGRYIEFSKQYPSLAKAAEKAVYKLNDEILDQIPDEAKERFIRDSGTIMRAKRA